MREGTYRVYGSNGLTLTVTLLKTVLFLGLACLFVVVAIQAVARGWLGPFLVSLGFATILGLQGLRLGRLVAERWTTFQTTDETLEVRRFSGVVSLPWDEIRAVSGDKRTGYTVHCEKDEKTVALPPSVQDLESLAEEIAQCAPRVEAVDRASVVPGVHTTDIAAALRLHGFTGLGCLAYGIIALLLLTVLL